MNFAKTNTGILWQTDIQQGMWTADLWHCHGHRFAKAFNRVNHKLKYHQQHQGDSLHRGHHGQKSGIRFKHPVKRTWSRQDKHWTDGRRCLLRGRNQTFFDTTVKTHLGNWLWDWAKAGQSSDRVSLSGFNPGIKVHMLPWVQTSYMSCSECCQTCLTWRCHMHESTETSIFSLSKDLAEEQWLKW